MLTNEATPAPAGTRRHRIGRTGVATAVLLSLSAASLSAAVLPGAAFGVESVPTAAVASVAPVRIQAEDYTSNNGGGTKKEGTSPSGNVGGTWNGAELYFDAADLGTDPLSTVTVRYSTRVDGTGNNRRVAFYLDEKTEANKVGEVSLPLTNGWGDYQTATADLDTEVSGDHTLIAVLLTEDDPAQPVHYVANIDWFEFGPASLPESFLGTADAWKYSDDGTDPSGDGTLSWTEADFDDAAWKEGVGSFGTKNGGADLGNGFVANTVVQYKLDGSENDVPTYHFRNEFEVSAGQLAQLQSLQGRIVYDDAVRIYVNGEKVAGFVDDRVDGAANQNLAYAGDSKGDPQTSTFTIPADALQAGENTIAVALYQDRESSSDIYLDLTSLVPVEQPTGPVQANISDVVLGVGATEAERSLAWYSDKDVTQVAQLAKASEVTGDSFPASARTIETTNTGGTTSGEFFRDVTLDGLEENTEYAYRVGSDDAGWSDLYTFRTQDFSGDFSFLFFGDPQVGASGNLARDEAGWIDTVNVATQSYPDAELLFSAGDQVENAPNEDQYTTFLKPEQLRSIPLVATNGNHDVGSKAYEQHFNLPNEDLTAGAGTSTSSGGDYWFIYKDVLFLNLNSNSRDYASHYEWMEQVIAEHGDEAKWKVLAFHHSIYSVANHATDGDIIERRSTMPQEISKLGFDVVLMGHDHHYTRSYLIKDGELADPSEQEAQGVVEAKDGEVLYLTANSASGSKYYDLNGAQTDEDRWWASVRNQEKVRNYSVLEVSDDAITMRTLRSEANGAANPVNSVVDEVTLVKDTAPELTVPADGEIALGSAFDPLDGVSAEDNVDGDLTSEIEVEGAVDTAEAGAYELVYRVQDARGNVSTAERTVTVLAEGEEPGTGEPGTGEPGTGEPGTGEPGTGEPGTGEPGTGEPGTGEPGTGEPGTGEPGTGGAPSSSPAAPVADGGDLPADLRDAVQITVDGRTATITGLTADEWYYGYVYSTPTALGWAQADGNGAATMTLPADLADGTHRLAVLDAAGDLVGWVEITVSGGEVLATTGSDAAWGFAAIGSLLFLAGGALLVARRRRAIQH
ncbi:immunoglobulin-like domain-containing protein [Microbacterium tumbae]